MNAAPAHPGSTAIAAANHIREIQGLPRKSSCLATHGLELTLDAFSQSLDSLCLRGINIPFAALYARKNRAQPVVLLLRNRIEFVIMTSGAVDRDRRGSRHHLRDHVVQIAGTRRSPQLFALGFHMTHKIPWTRRQKSRGDLRLGIPALEDVARDLLPKESIVRLVLVEGLDHIVAVTPRIGPQLVTLKSMRIGVVSDIQPMPRPALAIARA